MIGTLKDISKAQGVQSIVFSKNLINVVNVKLPEGDMSPASISGRLYSTNVPAWKYNKATKALLSHQKKIVLKLKKEVIELLPPHIKSTYLHRRGWQSLFKLFTIDAAKPVGLDAETVEKIRNSLLVLDEIERFYHNFVLLGMPLLLDPYSSEFYHLPLLSRVNHGLYLLTYGSQKMQIQAKNAGIAYDKALKLYIKLLEKAKEEFREKANANYSRFKTPSNHNILDGYKRMLGETLRFRQQIRASSRADSRIIAWKNISHDFMGIQGAPTTLIFNTTFQGAIKPAFLALMQINAREVKKAKRAEEVGSPYNLSDALYQIDFPKDLTWQEQFYGVDGIDVKATDEGVIQGKMQNGKIKVVCKPVINSPQNNNGNDTGDESSKTNDDAPENTTQTANKNKAQKSNQKPTRYKCEVFLATKAKPAQTQEDKTDKTSKQSNVTYVKVGTLAIRILSRKSIVSGKNLPKPMQPALPQFKLAAARLFPRSQTFVIAQGAYHPPAKNQKNKPPAKTFTWMFPSDVPMKNIVAELMYAVWHSYYG